MIDSQIKRIFRHAIEVLKNNKRHIGASLKKGDKERFMRDIHQRADEACLIYSAIFDICFNDAKEELDGEELFIEEAEKK